MKIDKISTISEVHPVNCHICDSHPRHFSTIFEPEKIYYSCYNYRCEGYFSCSTLDEWNILNTKDVKMISEIKSYYVKRGLKEPTALEALMWLISEVGELVEAYYRTPDATSNVGMRVDIELIKLIAQCRVVESIVANGPGWVRNNQPKGTYDTEGECADVLMMLSVFADKAGLSEPELCLRAKMARKLHEIDDKK